MLGKIRRPFHRDLDLTFFHIFDLPSGLETPDLSTRGIPWPPSSMGGGETLLHPGPAAAPAASNASDGHEGRQSRVPWWPPHCECRETFTAWKHNLWQVMVPPGASISQTFQGRCGRVAAGTGQAPSTDSYSSEARSRGTRQGREGSVLSHHIA